MSKFKLVTVQNRDAKSLRINNFTRIKSFVIFLKTPQCFK